MFVNIVCKLSLMGSNLGDRIKEAIENSGIDHRTVAQRCGVSAQAVYAWTRGEINNVRAEHLYPLADLTGFEARWIALGEGPRIAQFKNAHVARVLAVMEPMPEYVQAEARAAVERVVEFAGSLIKNIPSENNSADRRKTTQENLGVKPERRGPYRRATDKKENKQ